MTKLFHQVPPGSIMQLLMEYSYVLSDMNLDDVWNLFVFRRNACTIGIGLVRSFDTKSAPRISRKPVDLESPNFTGTSIPTLSTATPDMTSLSVIAKKLSKIPPPTASGGISQERFKLGPRNFTHLPRHNRHHKHVREMTPLAASGRHLSKFGKRPKKC